MLIIEADDRLTIRMWSSIVSLFCCFKVPVLLHQGACIVVLRCLYRCIKVLVKLSQCAGIIDFPRPW